MSPPDSLHILLVDDHAGEALRLRRLLEQLSHRQHRLDWTPDAQGALAELGQGRRHDIYLVDWLLGGGRDGLGVLHDLQAAGCRAPVVILTAYPDPELDRRVLQEGAADFLVKAGLTPHQLDRSLRHAWERGRLLQALAASEARYRTLAANLPNGTVLLLDAQGHLLFAEGRPLERIGLGDWSPGQRPPGPLAPPLARHLAEALAGRTSSCELQAGEHCLLVSLAAFPDGPEGTGRALAMVQEVTELRQAQLAAIARDRMAVMGALASALAHEFNNLHGIMLGNAEQALRLDRLPAPARIRLEVVRSTANRAGGLTRSLLSLARGGHGTPTPIRLAQVVRDMVELVRSGCESEGIAIELRLDEVPALPLQVEAMGQVVMNLLLNARQALAGRPAGRIEVALATLDGNAVLTVADNGPGIPAEILPRLFSPFFTTRAGRGGTGLGLSICRSIVNAHGGSIEAGASPLGGACFGVRLPLVEAAPAEERGCPTPLRPARAGRALVADDEARFRDLLRDELEEVGWTVACAADGIEALARLEREDFDVAFIDLHMPRLAGPELLRRRRGRGQERLVAITGAAADEDLTGLADAVLAKPFPLDQLHACLARVLAEPAVKAVAASPGAST